MKSTRKETVIASLPDLPLQNAAGAAWLQLHFKPQTVRLDAAKRRAVELVRFGPVARGRFHRFPRRAVLVEESPTKKWG